MKTTELDFSKLFAQADEVYEFCKSLTFTTARKSAQQLQQFTFNKRAENKEFIYLATSGVLDGKVGWRLYASPIAKQEMKSFFNKVSEIGNSLIGLTYTVEFTDDKEVTIEIVTRDKNELGKIEKTILYKKQFSV